MSPAALPHNRSPGARSRMQSGTREVPEGDHVLPRRFRHPRKVGGGAMGIVFKARDLETGMVVAVKVLRHLEHEDRFSQEAKVLSTVQHRNIVRHVAHGVGPQNHPWLAMEWLDGEDLDTRLGRGPLSVRETVALANALGRALAWAHERGLVHRDIKPSNLFLPGFVLKRVKLLDFGLARLAAEGARMTVTGTLMGTLEYMPPEQALDAKRVGPRADVYSLGAVLFHCLAGRTAVGGKTVSEALTNLLAGVAVPLHLLPPETPPELVALIGRMLARDLRIRPKDGSAVLSALAELPLDAAWDSLSTIPVAGAWTEPTALHARPEPEAGPEFASGTPRARISGPNVAIPTRPFCDVTARMPGAPPLPLVRLMTPTTPRHEGARENGAPGPTELTATLPMRRRRLAEWVTLLLLFVCCLVLFLASTKAREPGAPQASTTEH